MTLSAVSKSVPSLSKSILIFSVSLAFAVIAPAAFAQRGGGGHGGGHVGGVHGGFVAGASGAAHGSARAAGSGGRALSASGHSVAPARTSTRGYSRNTFVSASATRDGNYAAASHYMPVMSQSSLGSRTFAADNYFWEDPPQQGRPMPVQGSRPLTQPMTRPLTQPMARPFFTPVRPLMHSAPRPMTAAMWHPNSLATPLARPMIHPMPNNPSRQPASAGTPFLGTLPMPVFNPFFNAAFNPRFHPIGPCFGTCLGFGGGPFFNPFFFGFGFGPCFAGGFGCGFGPFGFGDLGWGLYGYGYGNGSFYPPAPEIPAPPVNPTEENPPLNFAPNYYFLPEVPSSEPENAQKPTVKLVLKDGTIFDVYSYWLENNQLFYVTTYNIKTSIPVDDLDLQKTVDLNQKLGVTFTLSNKPPDQQQPQEDQQQP